METESDDMAAVKMLVLMKGFLRDESGATAIEYGLIAGAIALGLMPFLPNFKDFMVNKMGEIADAMSNN